MRTSFTLSFGRFRGRQLTLLGILVVGAVAAYQLAQYVISDDLAGLAYAGILFVVGVISIRILNNWRNGVYFFLAWLLFEDLARKFLGNNMAIYFAKDALLAVVYLSFFIACRRKEAAVFRPPFLVPLLLFVWFGVLQMFNPASPSLVFGVLGLKLFFSYVPLLFVGY